MMGIALRRGTPPLLALQGKTQVVTPARQAIRRITLDSLTRQVYPTFSVLLVDNGSTDDSVASVRARWPSVEIVELHENAGLRERRSPGRGVWRVRRRWYVPPQRL